MTLLSSFVVKAGVARRGIPGALLLLLFSQAVCAEPTDFLLMEKIKKQQEERSNAWSSVPVNHPKQLKSHELYFQGRDEMEEGHYGKAIGMFTTYIAMHKQESKSIKNESKAS